MIDTAQEIGLVHMDHALGLTQLIEWMQLTGVSLEFWEIETIRYISISYINALHSLKDDKELPPYMSESQKQRYNNAHAQSRLAMAREFNKSKRS